MLVDALLAIERLEQEHGRRGAFHLCGRSQVGRRRMQIADIQAHLARVGNQNFVHAGSERLPQTLPHADKCSQGGGEHEPGVPDHQAEAERLDGRCGRSRQRTH